MRRTMWRNESNRTVGSSRGERGASIVLMAIAMVALLSMVALAIDIGMLLTARTEAQRAADAAALAGAGALINGGADPEARARQFATEWASQNTVRDVPVTLLPEDIEVDLANERVRVTVVRSEDRGDAIDTWFARVFGVNLVDIGAVAAAEAQLTGAAKCVKPFAIPDYWDDVNANGVYDAGEPYDPAVHGYGSSWRNSGEPGDDTMGHVNDLGRQIDIKYGGPEFDQSGWYFPFAMPQEDGGPPTGGARYQQNIETCNTALVELGQEYDVEPGNMQGPTEHGVETLIAEDPLAVWNSATNTVDDSDWGLNWESGPRVGIVPVFDPSREFDPGRKPIIFTNFIAVFFEEVHGSGNNQRVTVRVLYPDGAVGGAPNNGTTIKVVRLVE